MKKIAPLILAVMVFTVTALTPVMSAFAASNSLLIGTNMNVGSDQNSTTATTTYITDNNATTFYSLGKNGTTADTFWYTFPSTVSINSAYLQPSAGSYSIVFYDNTGTALYTHTLNNIAGVQYPSFPTVNNVKKVAVINNTVNSQNIAGFDVFSAPVVTHDELTNLNLTATDNNVGLTWDIPSTNTAFTGSKIYRNGTLIKTLDKNTKVYTDSTVQASTAYTYKVTATYSDNFETSGISKTTTTLEAPKPAGDVTNVKADPSYNEVNLTWDNPTDANFDKVKIYRDGVFLSESTSTSFKDSTVNPLTSYEYKITTISTDGLESSGVIETVKTLVEPAPAIVAGVYKTDANGDYEFSWTEPTTGQVKILIDGQEYQTVDASLLKVLIPKPDMKYDYLGNPKVTLIPISSSGLQGDPIKPDPIDSSAGTKVPFSVNDLIGSGMGLIWLIGPFFLLVLVFLLVPKLRNLIFGSFRKNGQAPKTDNIKDENTRRFHSTETNIKDQQDKAQIEHQEKERLERKQRQEKEYLSRIERQEKEAIEKAAIIREHRQPRESKFRFTRAERAIRETRDPRIPKAPRIPRDRTRPTRTPRAERER